MLNKFSVEELQEVGIFLYWTSWVFFCFFFKINTLDSLYASGNEWPHLNLNAGEIAGCHS